MANAYSYLCGFELGSPNEGNNSAFTVNFTVQTSVVRSGVYAGQANVAGVAGKMRFNNHTSSGSFTKVFASVRMYVQIGSLPGVTTTILGNVGGGALADRLKLNSDGTLTMTDTANANAVSSTRTLSADSLWHRIEWDLGWSSGNGRQVYVDGVLWASSAATAVGTPDTLDIGVNVGGEAATANVYFDDILVDSGSFTANGFPGDSKQILLKPTAGNNAGSWTDGAGGTGDIHAGVASIPPVGVAAATAAAKIKNAASGTALDYVATIQSYSVGGVPSGSTINAIVGICNTGEEVSTGTKGGAIWCASNPAQSAVVIGTDTGFIYGDDLGALGTFPTNWATSLGIVAVLPAVTLTTAPTVTVRKGSSTTRVVDVDFMGLYVDYTPPPIGKTFLSPQAVKRASIF